MKKLKLPPGLTRRLFEAFIVLLISMFIQLINYSVNQMIGLYDNLTYFQKWAHYGVDVALLYAWLTAFFILDHYASQARKRNEKASS